MAENNGAVCINGYLYNLQGDVVALVDGTGTKVVEYTYDAWGKPTGKTGTMASTLGAVQPFRYRGYVFDEETGNYYLRSRYYRPEWCRFVSADKLIKGNLYCYCEDSPVCYSDEEGYESIWSLVYIWKNYTQLFNMEHAFTTYARVGMLVVAMEYENGQYYISDATNTYWVKKEDVIIWYGDSPDEIDRYCKEYFKNQFVKGKKDNFLRKGNSYHQRNAALAVLLIRYFETQQNGRGFKPTVSGSYDYDLERAVKEFQARSGLVPDGIWGVASYEAMISYFKNYYESIDKGMLHD